ncbi:hypothetical protein GCM10020254_70650 [Streptomyces goshikiensis]
MSPRSASVNEELRRRSRERLLHATVELVGERGYEATTLGDIADRAGTARGLISYYFPGKRHLLQSAVHRLMHLTLEAALEREPRTEDGRERLARAVDAILGLARDRPRLMRTHMAGILQAEGFVRCSEQQRLAELLRETVVRYGSPDPDTDYPLAARAADGRGGGGAAAGGADADGAAAGRAVPAVRAGLGAGSPAGRGAARRNLSLTASVMPR